MVNFTYIPIVDGIVHVLCSFMLYLNYIYAISHSSHLFITQVITQFPLAAAAKASESRNLAFKSHAGVMAVTIESAPI